MSCTMSSVGREPPRSTTAKGILPEVHLPGHLWHLQASLYSPLSSVAPRALPGHHLSDGTLSPAPDNSPLTFLLQNSSALKSGRKSMSPQSILPPPQPWSSHIICLPEGTVTDTDSPTHIWAHLPGSAYSFWTMSVCVLCL